ncbi:Pex19p [Sugiyamaella lignohabitans]|uniref:Pex19p n=1 Tax=Sugiyamaella lignohabitans TaxID=796027 RepID=A0A167FTS6_9ASCO|nr:Pex19p [Sugiyamaella lignohabitans]ANB15693.1 Pex19p [Sugiyamaella lignohabitans]
MSRHEEDDLDDLDDLLDDFAAQVLSKPPGADLKDAATRTGSNTSEQEVTTDDTIENSNSSAKSKTSTANGSEEVNSIPTAKSSTTAPAVPKKEATSSKTVPENDPSVPELDDQFANQLQQGMDHLLGELKDSKEAQQQFEALIQGLMGSTGGTTSASSTTNKAAADTNTAPQFQDTIAQTMERLKESRTEMDQKAQSSSEEDFLMSMLKELEGAAGSSGSDLDGLLGEMLKELSSKAILYEPMKEMHDKFPAWLEEHGSTITGEEKTRYLNQQRIVSEIVNKFEDPKYSDDDDACKTYIGQRMEEMQKSGAPPPELMGDLASGSIPGLDMNAPDGGLSAEEGCPVQ